MGIAAVAAATAMEELAERKARLQVRQCMLAGGLAISEGVHTCWCGLICLVCSWSDR